MGFLSDLVEGTKGLVEDIVGGITGDVRDLGRTGQRADAAGAQFSAQQAQANAALQELLGLSREQFDFWKGLTEEYKAFLDSPTGKALELRAAELLTPEGQAEYAGRRRADTQKAIADQEAATERRQRSFGLDPSSPAARAGVRGADVAEGAALASAGNAGREEAYTQGANTFGQLAGLRAGLVQPGAMAAGLQGISNVATGQTNLAGQSLNQELTNRELNRSTFNTILGGLFSGGKSPFGSAAGGSVGGEDSVERLGLTGGPVEDAASRADDVGDRIPAQLSPDEYVATAEAARYHGRWLYDWLEEAARRGVPGVPMLLSSVDPSSVPMRVAGQPPSPAPMHAARGGFTMRAGPRKGRTIGSRIGMGSRRGRLGDAIANFFSRLQVNSPEVALQRLRELIGAQGGGAVIALNRGKDFTDALRISDLGGLQRPDEIVRNPAKAAGGGTTTPPTTILTPAEIVSLANQNPGGMLAPPPAATPPPTPPGLAPPSLSSDADPALVALRADRSRRLARAQEFGMQPMASIGGVS